MDWGDFLNKTAQDYVYSVAMPEETPAVIVNPSTGSTTTEGQPASGGVKGLLSNPLVLVGGVAAIGLVLFLALRK